MDRDEHLERKFAELFAGRMDAYGTDEGGCVHLEVVGRTALDVATDWAYLWHEHLNEPGRGIGIYPINKKNMVRWGCVDIDTGNKPGALYEEWWDAWQHSRLLERVLAELGIKAWLEVTRSAGVHVWVFATEPVPARIMRRALLAAHQIADLPQKEVNPKQETLAEGKVGNYVRLPYPCGRELGRQYVAKGGWNSPFMPDDLLWEEFTVQAYEDRSAPLVFEQAAELYRAAPAVASTNTSSYDPSRIKHRSAYAAALIVNGPKGTDRSAYLWMVARTLCEADVPFRDAWDALCEADRRWGKFHERDQVEHLYRLLEKAYA